MAFDKGVLRAHHLSLIAMIIGFLSGYDSGVAGGILTFPAFESDFRYTKKGATAVTSFTVALQVLGDFVSCLYAWYVTEKLGRRKGILIFSTVFIVGVILQVAPTHSLGAWYFARVVSGLGQGGLMIIVPIFSAEMAPKNLRGRLGAFYQWQYTLGIFMAYWIDYGVQKNIIATSSSTWQIPVGLQLFPGALLFAGMFTVPESVRWLLKKDRQEEAWKSLTWVRASEGEEVAAEFAEIQAGLAAERELRATAGRFEIVAKGNRRRLLTGCLAFFFQIATGATALAYFSPQFFKLIVPASVPDAEGTVLLLTGLFGAVKLIACSFFVLFFANKLGRRKPLIYGGSVMAVCMLITAIILRTADFTADGSVPPAGRATVAMIFLAIMAYNFSWGPVPWTLVPEIFPNRIREIGVALCMVLLHFWQFIFTLVTPYMIAGTGVRGWGTFLFYAVFDIIMVLWVIFFMPETQDKSLERVNAEIDHDEELLNKKIDAERADSVGAKPDHIETTESDSAPEVIASADGKQ